MVPSGRALGGFEVTSKLLGCIVVKYSMNGLDELMMTQQRAANVSVSNMMTERIKNL